MWRPTIILLIVVPFKRWHLNIIQIFVNLSAKIWHPAVIEEHTVIIDGGHNTSDVKYGLSYNIQYMNMKKVLFKKYIYISVNYTSLTTLFVSFQMISYSTIYLFQWWSHGCVMVKYLFPYCILFIYLFCSFAPHYFYFVLCTFSHCKSTIPVFYLLYCIYFATMAFLPLPPLSHLICSHRI